MTTVWQGNVSLSPGISFTPSSAQRAAASAILSGGLTFGATPQSLFSLMQAFMDSQEEDQTARRDAIEALVAYHCASISSDKYSAVKEVAHINRQALLLLDYMWNVFGSSGGVFGSAPMPHSPSLPTLSQIVSTTASRRNNQGLHPLPGPQN